MDLDKYFKKAELIPAIVTDIDTGAVLMLAYMNKESLKLTLETGYTWFWSRSRKELWNKGVHNRRAFSLCDNHESDKTGGKCVHSHGLLAISNG